MKHLLLFLAAFYLEIATAFGVTATTPLPAHFEPNVGQFNPDVQFTGRAGGRSIQILKDGSLRPSPSLVVRFRGSKTKATWSGLDRLPGHSNYLNGNDSSKWLKNVPQFAKVIRTDIYPGIDVVFYGTSDRQNLEFDLAIRPGADPHRIELQFEGSTLSIDSQGNLVAGDVIQRVPAVFQLRNGRKTSVPATYRIAGNRARLILGSYDSGRELVVDPILSWAASVGPPLEYTRFDSLTSDANGNVYLAGLTASRKFPLLNAYQNSAMDVIYQSVVVKLDRSGTAIAYATYFGGSSGGTVSAIAVNAQGSAYVLGDTNSKDFPLVNAAVTDPTPIFGLLVGFFSKFSPAGDSLEFSTYVRDVFTLSPPPRAAIVIDQSGDALVRGSLTLSKYDSKGSPKWTNSVVTGALAVDPDGNPVGAVTKCPPQPLADAGAFQTKPAGGCDVLVQKWKSDGGRLISQTLFGGEGNDYVSAIAVSPAGSIYITGNTTSRALPVTAGAAQPSLTGWLNGYLAVFDSGLANLTGATYFGGNTSEQIGGLSLGAEGEAYVSGLTLSNDFPQMNPIPEGGTPLAAAIPYSNDGGVTWTAFATPPPLWTVSSLTVSDPIWIAFGTGDQGYALYRSPDRGATWKRFPESAGNGILNYWTRVTQSPADPLRIYIANTLFKYFYVSSDGGLTFAAISGPTAPLNSFYGFLVPHPVNAAIVFGLGGDLTVSKDGARNWSVLRPPKATSGGYRGIAFDSVNPSGMVTCLGEGLYRTADSAETWKQVDIRSCHFLEGSRTQTMFAHVFVGDGNGALVRSDDGGATWTDLSFDGRVLQLMAGPDGSSVAVSDGAKLSSSTDRGVTWTSTDLPMGFLYNFGGSGILVDPDRPATLYGRYSGQTANVLTAISADATTVRFSTFLGSGYIGELPGSPSPIASDGLGNLFLTPPGWTIATPGSINIGGAAAIKLAVGH